MKKADRNKNIKLSGMYRKSIVGAFLFSFFFLVYPDTSFASDSLFIKNKIKGLMIGTCLGDALGGPIEFQDHTDIQATPFPPKLWKDTFELMDQNEIQQASERIVLREYKYLRPVPEPYGHWGTNAPPGTVTDDSRHKFILLGLLRKALNNNQWPVTDKDLAQAYLDWSKSETITSHSGYDTLCDQWLGESYKAINWLLGNRESGKAYPLERLWNALPTCYGQMSLTPVATLFPGDPERAYLATYNLAWFENGFAKDMTAALVAGLSKGLMLDPYSMSDEELWRNVINTMCETDPYAYSEVPWSERSVLRWLNLANHFVNKSDGSPAKLFEYLEEEFMYTTKWEAQVPFVIMFSTLKICNYNPLASLQLSIEWGWDHDSYAQLLGAFIGAIYGPGIFVDEHIKILSERLVLDYDENPDEWVDLLWEINKLGNVKKLIVEKK